MLKKILLVLGLLFLTGCENSKKEWFQGDMNTYVKYVKDERTGLCFVVSKII